MARVRNDGAGDLILRVAGKAINITPEQEVAIDDHAFEKIKDQPVVAAWIESGRLVVTGKREKAQPAGKGSDGRKPANGDGDDK